MKWKAGNAEQNTILARGVVRSGDHLMDMMCFTHLAKIGFKINFF